MSPLYKGSAFRRFLIDRFAMGFDTDHIRQEFKASQGVEINDKDIDGILGPDSENDIKVREQELLAELSSTNFFEALNRIKTELESVRQIALDERDLKAYAQLTNSMLKSVEVLVATSDAFKRKFDDQQAIQTQNNFYVLNVLQKDGLIDIKDEKKLRELWGIRGEADGLRETEKKETKKIECEVHESV